METTRVAEIGDCAEKFKNQGFKCAESVVMALAKDQGIESELLSKIGTVFSSGMARTCGTCGALTGAMMGIGLALGRSTADESADPSQDATRKLIADFEKEFGARDCHELLGCDIGSQEGQTFFKENKQRLKKECTGYTRRAAEIAAVILEKPDAETNA